MTAALELVNLTSGYGSSTVVHGVSLEIAPGEILALVGKNGMGKSSLLKTILSFLPAWDGAVRIDGRDVTRLAPFRKRALGATIAASRQASPTSVAGFPCSPRGCPSAPELCREANRKC